MRRLLPLLALCACNPDPGFPDEQVGYRDVLDEGPTSAERGNIIISEILWSGSIAPDGDNWRWDPDDVFIEVRNEGYLPVKVVDWFLIMEGPIYETFRLPPPYDPDPNDDVEPSGVLQVGEEVFFAAKTSGCFPEPDGILEGLQFPTTGDGFRLVLKDADERLVERAGSRSMPPYAGGYDLVVSRSMERINLMFGESGSSPQMWHHYTDNTELDVPNNDRIAEECRARTLASPGRANSPDYSGAYASGGFE
jgi:hypothetical protein